jgi:hypothetical protein
MLEAEDVVTKAEVQATIGTAGNGCWIQVPKAHTQCGDQRPGRWIDNSDIYGTQRIDSLEVAAGLHGPNTTVSDNQHHCTFDKPCIRLGIENGNGRQTPASRVADKSKDTARPSGQVIKSHENERLPTNRREAENVFCCKDIVRINGCASAGGRMRVASRPRGLNHHNPPPNSPSSNPTIQPSETRKTCRSPERSLSSVTRKGSRSRRGGAVSSGPALIRPSMASTDQKSRL